MRISEALGLLARAGWRPRAMIEVLELLAARDARQPVTAHVPLDASGAGRAPGAASRRGGTEREGAAGQRGVPGDAAPPQRAAASSDRQSHAAPLTPLASPCAGGLRRVATRSEKTNGPQARGTSA